MTHIFTTKMIININEAISDEFHTDFGIRYDADIFAASCCLTPMDVAKSIGNNHPFVDGNKRTALVILKFHDTIEKTIKENHDVLELLSVI